MKKLLSIIVPFYNSLPYFYEMLNSLEPQFTDEIEAIFVNDGSTDESAKELNRFCNNPNVKVLSIAHSGVSAARNAGIAVAQGEYLWFMDSDDLVCEDAVKTVIDHIVMFDKKPDMLVGDLLVFEDQIPRELNRVHFPFDHYLGKINVFPDPFQVFREELFITSLISSTIFKTSFCKSHNILFNENMVIDETQAFRVAVILSNPQISFINQALFTYRMHDKMHPSLKERRISKKQCLQMIHEYEKLFFFFSTRYVENRGKKIMTTLFADDVFLAMKYYCFLNDESRSDYVFDLYNEKLVKKTEDEQKLLHLVCFSDIVKNKSV